MFPGKEWATANPAEVGMNADMLEEAKEYALTSGGSGYITRHGKLVMQWGDPSQKYDLKSTTKSFGATALAVAIRDGQIALDDKAIEHHPDFGVPPEKNADTGWLNDITIRHLATQTAGFAKPGGYEPLLFEPGSKWHYSDGGPNWLAECLTLIYKRDLEDFMFQRIFTPLGITKDDFHWRNNAYRNHKIQGVMRREFGSGIHANVDAMARLGYLYLREGRWGSKRLIPKWLTRQVRKPLPFMKGLPEHKPSDHGNASDHYSLLWWNNADGTLQNIPKDAHWTWGLYDSLIVVIPSLDIVVSRTGKSWERTSDVHYNVLKPFFEPIVASCSLHAESQEQGKAPYPPSDVITAIEWAPVESIVYKAEGSDNWPLAWADDGHMYTTFGDGWGFKPKVEEKLSLGFARVSGGPKDFTGHNIRSPDEQKGGGRSGRKASGLLCVDGTLYALVRNANQEGQQSILAWSDDHAQNWTWADWVWKDFGHPAFLNFGRDYSQVPEPFQGYVYFYSPDTPDAYIETDEVILARAPVDRITDKSTYQFYAGSNNSGEPIWASKDQRESVFTFPGGCNRMDVTYSAALDRYLMTMRSRAKRDGINHFSIYDAPKPWGPWTTVYYAEHWKTDGNTVPLSDGNKHWGEVAHIPSKWISEDGRKFYLVFAGNDSFAVRKATLTIQ